MSAPVCESKAQCQINGLAGTAMIMSVMVLIWAGAEAVAAGIAGGEALRLLALLAPTFVSVVYAIVTRVRGQVYGWLGLAITAGGTAWGVFVLNGGLWV